MFSALAEERIFAASEIRRGDVRRGIGSVLLVALIYGTVALVVLERREALPTLQSVEIPVEVVVAPPPSLPTPPEPKKEPAPKPPERIEKPAYDAPKQGVADKDNGEKPLDGKPAPAPQASDKPSEVAGAQGAVEAPPAPGPAQPVAAPTDRRRRRVRARPQDGDFRARRPLLAAPGRRPRQAANVRRTAQDGIRRRAPIKAPVAGGAGPAEYLNIVIGLIRAHLRKPQETRIPGGMPYGVMVFVLDSDGRVASSWFVQHSGSPALDRAQADALDAAAPFPKPPYPGRAIEYHFLVD